MIALHGGCGKSNNDILVKNLLIDICCKNMEKIKKGASSLDVCTQVVAMMENSYF